MIISFTGFMGCGKSSVGRRLSELLCCRFMDLDDAIEKRVGKTIPEIFAESGEKEFRRIEKETLSEVLRGQRGSTVPAYPLHSHSTNAHSLILALGGGTVMTQECEEMVHEETVCVYLKASVDTLIEHLSCETSGRPLLKDADLRSRIMDLMSKRASTYERAAHIIIETDGKSIDEIACEIGKQVAQ